MNNQNPAEIEALKKSIQRSKVERAKAMPAERKLLEGARLFDMVRAWMLDGIRKNFIGESNHSSITGLSHAGTKYCFFTNFSLESNVENKGRFTFLESS